MLDPKSIARALGGEAHGIVVLAPGPGHSANDRSLKITVDAKAPGGFVVHSYAGDDAIECKDYVRKKAQMDAWKPREKSNSSNAHAYHEQGSKVVAEYVYRTPKGEPYLKVLRYEPKSFR